MTRRIAALLGTPVIALLLVIGAATPAAAVMTGEQLAQLGKFTEDSQGGYNAWNDARMKQSDYRYFIWSTDYCSQSPDKPLGFDFQLPCYRHDFGYRNYKDVNQFAENKSRLDLAFYNDLKRKCATYNYWVRGSCYSLALTYYKAVVALGTPAVSTADIDRAAKLKAEGQARRAAAMDAAA